MSFTNFSLDELAEHIGMDAREVRRLAEKGRVPGQKVGGVWRFNRATLLDWLQTELHDMNRAHIVNLERAMSDEEDAHIVSCRISLEGVDLALQARTRASLIHALAELAGRTRLVGDVDALAESLEEREVIMSTALPGGFSFPHPRRPSPWISSEPLICIGLVPAGIPFAAPDGRLTDVFVLLVSHDDRGHLRTLARLSLLFSHGLADQIRAAADREEVLAAVLAAEDELLRDRAG
jgi:PTS system nitrogen regulatory IIA component